MSQTLTPRQHEYYDFIRDYINQNEYAPRLDEIAEHFRVTSPTANKTLKTLQEKGLLYFDRDKVSGFYIRIPEIYNDAGKLNEIPITGITDRNGEVFEFPKYHGHIPYILPDGIKNAFALDSSQCIVSVKKYFAYAIIITPDVTKITSQ